jgi:L-alanine-DL-glutamate epimerase-like enolase superfamily enzyme
MSIIIELDLRLLRLTFRAPVRYGLDWLSGRDVAIVRLTDDEGNVGLGEIFEQPHPDAVATARTWALGRTPMELLVAGGPWVLGLLPHRLCGAIEGAIADLDARQSGVSLARSLAGDEVATEVPVNALVVATAPGPDVAMHVRALVAEGFGTIKLKLEGATDGAPAAWWTGTIAGVRELVGPDVALRVDLNVALSPESALAWLPSIAPLGLEYVEQPIAAEHEPQELTGLRDAGVPIAADESVTDVAAALDLIDAGCDVLVVKPARVGGPLRAAEIVQAASEATVPVVVSTLYETGVGLATSLHVAALLPGDRAHGLATGQLIADDPVAGTPQVIRGRMRVDGPGIGVTLP